MKTVVIGDIHGRSVWKLIVALENPDKVIFIGDYFDSFDISGVEQLHNFKEILEYQELSFTNEGKEDQHKTQVILLIGNHDHHYFPEVGNTGTSGYQHALSHSISHLITENRHCLQIAYQMDGFLFSHAGVSSEFMDNVFGKDEWQTETIAKDLNEMFKYKPKTFDFGAMVQMKKMSWLDPTGDNTDQSPIWIRPRSLMKANRDTLRNSLIQVFGHTQIREVDKKGGATGGRYYNIDCLGTSGEYMIIQDGEISFNNI